MFIYSIEYNIMACDDYIVQCIAHIHIQLIKKIVSNLENK